MLSPRSTYISLLKSQKTTNRSTNRLYQIYMGKKKVNDSSESKGKTQRNLSYKRYRFSGENIVHQDRLYFKRSQKNLRYSSKLQINSARRLSRNKSKVQLKSQANLEHNTHQEEFCQFKSEDEEKCRLVIKNNGKQQQHFIKITDISQICKFLHNCYPEANNFTTIPRNLALEYMLTLDNIPAEYFNGQSLYFKPEYQKVKLSKKQTLQSSISLKSFQIFHQIGSGGFSKVYLCRSKLDNNFYAMKLIDKQMVMKNQKKGIIMNERNIMSQSEHPFLIQLKYAFQSEKYIVFVVEYCAAGELFGLLKKYGRLSQEVVRFYIIQVLLGLSYLHGKKVIYRDIKPENILLGIDGHIKIADLGLAKPNMQPNVLAHSFCGSPEYMSPQMILQIGHSYPVDFYCVGALLYQLLIGLPPFYNQDPNLIYEAVLSEQISFPNDVALTIQCKKLIRSLLCKDPKQRLGSLYGVKQILSHPWFGKQDYKKFINKGIQPPFNFKNLEKLSEILDKHKENAANGVLKDQKCQSKLYTKLLKEFYYDHRSNLAEVNQNCFVLRKQLTSRSNSSLKSSRTFLRSDRHSKQKQDIRPSQSRKQSRKYDMYFPFNLTLKNFIKRNS